MAENSKELKKDTGTISTMFNGIASSYNLLNHLLSLDIDKLWRRKMVRFLCRNFNGIPHPKVLDIACGTGDSSIALYRKGMNVSGVDIAEKMLDVAIGRNHALGRKAARHDARHPDRPYPPLPDYIMESAENLHFADGRFDGVTVSLGIRNFDHRDACLREMHRVLRPGGILAILEFAKPRNAFIRYIYNIYLNHIMPFIGKTISKDDDAYKYLSTSIEAFPKYEAFTCEMEAAGFREVRYRKLTFGICALYTGIK